MTAPATATVPVGYIIKMFPRLSETFILNEVLELERQGLALHIFSLKSPVDAVFHAQTRLVRAPITYLPEKLTQAPVQLACGQIYVARRHRRAWRHGLRNALRHARAGGDTGNLLAFCQACCLVRQMGPIRHLHAHYANVPAKIALLVQRLTGATYSITTHAKDVFQNDPFASAKLQERMGRASFVVANSRFSADHIRLQLNAPTEIRVVHNGLDLDAFPARTSEPEQPLILSVGRLVEKKGFGDLLSACHLLKQRGVKFACEIVGTGAWSLRLKEQSRALNLGDCLKLTGPLPQQVLREHYVRATVFGLPCKRAADGDRDILPNAVKEAMATGVPVLTTTIEGMDELIQDGVNGLLVQPGDVPALADKLQLLLQDGSLRRRLSLAARNTIERHFDRRSNFAELTNLLQAAAGSPAFQTFQVETAMAHAYGAGGLH